MRVYTETLNRYFVQAFSDDCETFFLSRWTGRVRADGQKRRRDLRIPTIPACSIREQYITQQHPNAIAILDILDEEEQLLQFHFFVEDNNCVQEWRAFEKDFLTKVVVTWCQANRLRYSTRHKKRVLYSGVVRLQLKVAEFAQKLWWIVGKRQPQS